MEWCESGKTGECSRLRAEFSYVRKNPKIKGETREYLVQVPGPAGKSTSSRCLMEVKWTSSAAKASTDSALTRSRALSESG